MPAPAITMARTLGIGDAPVDALHDGGARRVAEAVDRRIVQRDDGDAVVGSITGAEGFPAQCSLHSSHSLRTASLARSASGDPSKTMRP